MTTAGEIIDFLDAAGRVEWRHTPDPSLEIVRPAPLSQGQPGAIAFLTATVANPGAQLAATNASIVLVDRRAELDDGALAATAVTAVIRSDSARLDFIRVVNAFFVAPRTSGIHPTAVVSDSAVLGERVAIGSLCTVESGCKLGDDTVLEAGVHLYPGVILGSRVHVHAGAVIGADGFGYERDAGGALIRFPHLGHVEIADDVEIGANTCIDRGTLGPTTVGRGTKINNLVHIAHNVRIGEDVIVTAQVNISGSTQIGARVWIGPSACVRDNVRVGDDATVGLAAAVTKDVHPGTTVVGTPARPIDEHRRLLDAWASVASETER